MVVNAEIENHQVVAIPSNGFEKYRNSIALQSTYYKNSNKKRTSRAPVSRATPRRENSPVDNLESRIDLEVEHSQIVMSEVRGRAGGESSETRVGKLKNKVWPPIRTSNPETLLGTGPTGTPRRNTRRTISSAFPDEIRDNDQNMPSETHRASCSHSISQGSTKSSVSNKYLSAVAPKGQGEKRPNLAIIEIPAYGHQEVGDLSIAQTASSFSEEESVSPQNKIIPPFEKPRSLTLDAEIEKIIERRVNAEVLKMMKQFQAEIGRIQTRMDLEYKDRVHALELKTHKMNSILSKMVSKKQQNKDRLEI
jgi:hypothetical protein